MPHRITAAGFVWQPAPPQTRFGRILAAAPAALAALILISCCLGVLAILGRSYEPRLDVFSPFLGHFVGLGLTAAAALWVERRRLMLLALGIMATFAAHAAPLYVDMDAIFPGPAVARQAKDAGPPQAALKVMAFNVWSQNRAPSDAVAAIAASDADVVLLSEIEGPIAEILTPLTALYPYRSACMAPEPCQELVLSRRPIRRSGGRVATHRLPGLSWAEIALPNDVVVTALVVHVHRPTLGWHRHADQIDGLVRFLRDLKTPVILGGDFNTTPLSETFARMAAGAGLVTWPQPMPTWPSIGPIPPQFGIDHILVSRDLQIESAGVGDAAGSDHRPIWSRIAVRPEPAGPAPLVGWFANGGT